MGTLFRTVGLALALTTVTPAFVVGCASDSTGDETTNVTAKGTFEVFEGVDGQYYFHLVAANGEIVLQSEGYVTRQGALGGVESVKVNGVLPERYEVLPAANGEYFFHLEAANGEIIGVSETYDSQWNAERGAETVRTIIASLAAPEPETDIQAAIELAAEGAIYTSEGDYPYTYVAAELANPDEPITIDVVRRTMAAFVDADPDADKPLAELYGMESTWAEWATDPASCAEETDAYYRELCVEQAELDVALAANLTDLGVYYFGSYGAEGAVDGVAVSIIIVGRTPNGQLAGVRTIAIWT